MFADALLLDAAGRGSDLLAAEHHPYLLHGEELLAGAADGPSEFTLPGVQFDNDLSVGRLDLHRFRGEDVDTCCHEGNKSQKDSFFHVVVRL